MVKQETMQEVLCQVPEEKAKQASPQDSHCAVPKIAARHQHTGYADGDPDDGNEIPRCQAENLHPVSAEQARPAWGSMMYPCIIR